MSDDPRYHTLKTWPEPFEAMLSGNKTFEYRRNDRGYIVGDVLHLREWDPGEFQQRGARIGLDDDYAYTGREMFRRVVYVLHGGTMGVPEGYVVMSVVQHGADHE